MNTILFYNENEEFGFFSNYYPVTIIIDGVIYASTEHYYQSQKTLDYKYSNAIRCASTPDDAKKLGNAPECPLRSDWQTYRNLAMMKALIAKFTQHEDLKERLLATGNSLLAENSSHDYYWGIGADGSGKNMLGQLLMATRASLM